MKIELDYPYSNDWRYGYLVVNPEGRQTVILYKSTNVVSSTSYARYLMAVHEGRYLTKDEEVDHINTDHTDDRIENLQILTVLEHKEKTRMEQTGQTYKSFICVCCGENFERSLQRINPNTKYCSIECRHKMTTPPPKISHVDYDKVQELLNEGMNDVTIARLLSINRNTVLNYRQKHGIKTQKFNTVKILENNIEDIKKMLSENAKKVDIMKKYDVPKNTLSRFLKRHNIL